jgi:hypothetical protein
VQLIRKRVANWAEAVKASKALVGDHQILITRCSRCCADKPEQRAYSGQQKRACGWNPMSIINTDDYGDVLRSREPEKVAARPAPRAALNLFENSHNKTRRDELITMPRHSRSSAILEPNHVSMSTSSLSDFSLTTFDDGRRRGGERRSSFWLVARCSMLGRCRVYKWTIGNSSSTAFRAIDSTESSPC